MKPSTVDSNDSLRTIPSVPQLTVEQKSRYNAFLSCVSEWTSSFHGSPLGEHERRFLTRECLLRYLRASKWVVADSLSRLDATIVWRRERQIDDLVPEGLLNEELRTGRLIPLGQDKSGRPCLYYSLQQDTPELLDIHMTYLCFMTERTIDMMQPGVESITVIIDLGGVPRAGMLSMAKIRAYISAFQEHNPERLGLAILPTNIPWWFHGIWKLMRLFLDPIVKDKVKFDRNAGLYVAEDNLWTKYGGDLQLELDHDGYWTEFLDQASKRGEAYRERWESAGGRLGESEEYLRGGVELDGRYCEE